MKKKIIGILVCTLLIGTFALPTIGMEKQIKQDDSRDVSFEFESFISDNLEITIDASNPGEVCVFDDVYHIYEGLHWRLTFTVFWDPPQPDRIICLWVDPETLPTGATFPECVCDYGEVSGVLEWTPSNGQAGTYEIIFYAGDYCYEPIGSFPITVIVHPYDPEPRYTFEIFERQEWHLRVTAYWVPPQEKLICLWADTSTLPYGATFTPECHCDIGEVSSYLYWTPYEGQAGEYIITLLTGGYCGEYFSPFAIKIIVYPWESPYIFSQVDFQLGDNSVENSAWGHIDVVYTGTEGFQYFNLVINGEWQIRNAPLSSEGVGIERDVGLIFDLDVEDGVDVTTLNYIADIGTTMLYSPPTGTPMTTPVLEKDVTVGGRGEDGVTVGDPQPVNVEYTWTIVDSAWKFGMENQDCGVDECIPTAFSNSLKYLDDNNDNLDIPDNLKGIDDLKGPTGWTAPDIDANGDPIPGTGGTARSDADWQGKKKALKDHVTTRKFPMDKIDDVMKELKRCQDVELIGPGHGAVVTGICKFSDGDYVIEVAHDTNQGNNGGTEEQMLIYDSDTGRITSGVFGFGAGQGLDWFIVECPKEGNNEAPEKPSKPDGPSSGRSGAPQTYDTGTTDPDGDDVSYGFDWDGNDQVDEWTTFYPSGQTISATHTWSQRGEYNIKVKAKDEYDAESEWSDPLPVTIPKSKHYMNLYINLYIQRFLDNHPRMFPLLQMILGL